MSYYAKNPYDLSASEEAAQDRYDTAEANREQRKQAIRRIAESAVVDLFTKVPGAKVCGEYEAYAISKGDTPHEFLAAVLFDYLEEALEPLPSPEAAAEDRYFEGV